MPNIKTDYDYQTKRIARRILRKAIAKSLPNLSTARVLCLPGAKGREITEVYDPLEIQRKNIVGFERDREAYSQLEAAGLGIELHHGDVSGFLAETNRVFDIVSLDYTQLPGVETLDPIINLSRRRLLSGKSLLYTNFYASRISQFVGQSLPVMVGRKVEREVSGDILTERISTFHASGTSEDIWDNIGNLKELKDYGITTFIAIAFGRNQTLIDSLMGRNLGQEDSITEEVPGPQKINKKCDRRRKTAYRDPFATVRFVRMFNSPQKPYVIKSIERFQYVSDDGSLMMSDIFFFSDFSELFERAGRYFKGEVVDSEGRRTYEMESKKCSFNKSRMRFAECIRTYDRACWRAEDLVSFKNQPRRRDITPREELDSELARKLLEEGWTYVMFEDRFRDITPARIAAYKAHITMGTYQKEDKPDEQPQKDEKPKETQERIKLRRGLLFFDSNTNRLNKNKAKINCGNNRVDTSSVLQGFRGNQGLLSRRHIYDLYVLNACDQNCDVAFSDLALKFCNSPFYLNLLVVGPEGSLDGDIQAARDLGAKIRVSRYATTNGYINTGSPIKLEQLLSQA